MITKVNVEQEERIDLIFNNKDYIRISKNGKYIELRCGDNRIRFNDLKDMWCSINPGKIRSYKNKAKLATLKFDDKNKTLYYSEIFENDVFQESVITVVRSNELPVIKYK